MVKIGTKLIILLCLSKSATHSVGLPPVVNVSKGSIRIPIPDNIGLFFAFLSALQIGVDKLTDIQSEVKRWALEKVRKKLENDNQKLLARYQYRKLVCYTSDCLQQLILVSDVS